MAGLNGRCQDVPIAQGVLGGSRLAGSVHIPTDVGNLYEVHDHRHASVILKHEFPAEFAEIIGALRAFRLNKKDITDKGGNESNIPKNFSKLLRPLGWVEEKLNAEFVVGGNTVSSDTHKIDYTKGRVALDLEWNSKDQTYDRDLFAFRTFHDFGRISVAVLITRSESLNPLFKQLGVSTKYGASTTWMGKLLPRLQAGRSGGCPVLIFGITPALVQP